MSTPARPRILCVDDEPQVLAGLALQLQRRYEVISATSGAQGLQLLQRDPAIAVIICDMRMPGMDGAAFLGQARRIAPGAARILLTGHTDLQSAITAVNEGQILRFLTKPCPPPQLHAAIEAALEQARPARDDTGLRRTLAVHMGQDLLTGLTNRARFSEALQEACAALAPGSGPMLALLHIKLDNMREINASLGHAAGDEVLRSVAGRLREHCPQARCVGRWGDTEFVLLLQQPQLDPHALLADASVLLARLCGPVRRDSPALAVHAVIGIACAPLHARSAESLTQYAMIAAHQAGLAGSGNCCLFRSDWAQRAEHRYELLFALREAIENDTLELHFQPIVDVSQGHMRAFEALARWNHPVLGPIPPAQFIALAEESGDMPRLGQWILRRACLDARRLAGVYCERVAVNISMQQLLHEDFFQHLEDALRLSGLATSQLELELTETVFSRDAQYVLEAVNELRRRGISVAIDDFGTGYSSLAYLQQLPVDVIKIDRSFVTNIGYGGETIIAAAQSIGRSFGMAVVIEGVENETLLRQLQALDATLFQGFHFARPMPLAAVADWYRDAAFRLVPGAMAPRREEPPPTLRLRHL